MPFHKAAPQHEANTWVAAQVWLSGCNEGVEAGLRCGAAHAGRSSVSDVTAAGEHEEHDKGRSRVHDTR